MKQNLPLNSIVGSALKNLKNEKYSKFNDSMYDILDQKVDDLIDSKIADVSAKIYGN